MKNCTDPRQLSGPMAQPKMLSRAISLAYGLDLATNAPSALETTADTLSVKPIDFQ